MKHTAKISAITFLSATLLLLLGTVSVSAQYYQLKVRTNDGLITPFNVDRVDSVYFEFVESDDNGNDEDETTVTGNVTYITNYTATITSWANILDNLSTDLKVGIIYTLEGTPNKNNGTQKTVSTSNLSSDAKYIINLTGLAPSTTYYYRSFVYQSGIWFYGNVKSFTTKGLDVEVVSGEVTKLTCYSAKLSGVVSIDASIQYQNLSYGICYDTNPTPTVNNTIFQASEIDQNGNFACQLRALTGSTTYYYRSYAYVDNHLSYGPVRSFTTKDDDVVITGELDTTAYTVKSTLKIGSGKYSTLALGVCYGTNETPTINDITDTANEVDDENNFVLTLTSIPFGTVVFYRSYVLIDNVAHYGEVKSFAGNSINTGDIDTGTHSVKSHIGISKGYKNITFGVCYGTSEIPTVDNQTITTSRVDANNYYILTLQSIPFGTVYYRSYVLINKVVYYGEVKSFAGKKMPDVNGYDFVDLGLSVLWATCNVGANNPEDYGDYYAWGDTATYYKPGYANTSSVKSIWKDGKSDGYFKSSYQYFISSNGLTKYCNDEKKGYGGYADTLTTLLPEDDVAHIKWGGDWRMPTIEEFNELLECCDWTTFSNGWKVTSLVDPSHFIILPAAKHREGWGFNARSYYWSSSLYTSDPSLAWSLYFGSEYPFTGKGDRCLGFPVRPVCP
jgi:hypothetical protein